MSAFGDKELARAIQMWRQGVSAARIAMTMGVTKNCILGRLSRAGVTGLARHASDQAANGPPRPGAVRLAQFDPVLRRALEERADAA